MSVRLDFKAINYAALAILPTLLSQWLPGGQATRQEYLAHDHLGGARA